LNYHQFRQGFSPFAILFSLGLFAIQIEKENMLSLQPITLSPGKEMGSHFPESLAHLKGNLAVLYNGFYQHYK
jgi:hypothetical protein